jgi:hypothetical protein
VVDRLNPFDLVFGGLADERFPLLAEGIATAGRDPRDRDAFVLVREVVELLRELAPEPGVGDGIKEMVAFVHASYLYWVDGRCRVRFERDTLDRMLGAQSGAAPVAMTLGRSYYLEVPPRRVWGMPVEGAPPEPLDGCFVAPAAGRVSVVAVFGLQPNRDGFTVVEVSGPRAARLARDDGSLVFSPKLEGGAAAGLFQIVGELELVELAFRFHDLVGPTGASPGVATVGVA